MTSSVWGASAVKVTREDYAVLLSNVIDRLEELLLEGNVTRIIAKDEKGKQLREIPATVGVIRVVIAPLASSHRRNNRVGRQLHNSCRT